MNETPEEHGRRVGEQIKQRDAAGEVRCKRCGSRMTVDRLLPLGQRLRCPTGCGLVFVTYREMDKHAVEQPGEPMVLEPYMSF